jgi:PhoPQ-activated pathogenicity-related protein
VEVPATGWKAYYVEVKFPGAFGMPFGSCCKMTVVPDTYPDFTSTKAAASEKESEAGK